jgi:hypothetical protein
MTDAWGPEDWQVYFDERAGTAEYDGKLSRQDAEARAFACCVAEWLIRHPAASSPDLSGSVGNRPADSVLSFARKSGAWPHSTCRVTWPAARRAEAAAALHAMGIGPGATTGKAAAWFAAPREKPTANTSELQRMTANTGYKCLKYRTTEVGTRI